VPSDPSWLCRLRAMKPCLKDVDVDKGGTHYQSMAVLLRLSGPSVE
jgi:hypothetical protein